MDLTDVNNARSNGLNFEINREVNMKNEKIEVKAIRAS